MRSYLDYPAFYSHPMILRLSQNRRWSISTPQKKPLGKKFLLNPVILGEQPKTPEEVEEFLLKRVQGADYRDPETMLTLPELLYCVPGAVNNAYYLNGEIDRLICLDIEPSCPPELKACLMDTNYIYGEVSMSGKGIHLFYDWPAELDKKEFEPFKVKKVVKSKDGTFEFLLEHWVTLTRNLIQPANPNPGHSIVDLMHDMIPDIITSNAKAVQVSIDRPDIYNEDVLLRRLETIKFSDPGQFASTSNWESSCAGKLRNTLNKLLATSVIKAWGHTYTDDEKIWIVYDALVRMLPFREKHNRIMTGGIPYLLDLSRQITPNPPTEKGKKS